MEEIVENKVSKLKQYGEKPIGVFGARASGKTMFFTILYEEKNNYIRRNISRMVGNGTV